jgi:hypothetical protein
MPIHSEANLGIRNSKKSSNNNENVNTSANANNGNESTPLKYNPNKCTLKASPNRFQLSLPTDSPYDPRNPASARAGKSYEELHKSESRYYRHIVADTPKSNGILPSQLPEFQHDGHKKLFTEVKLRTTTPPPSSVSARQGANRGFGAALRSSFDIFPADVPIRSGPGSSDGSRAAGVSKVPTVSYQQTLVRREVRESMRLGVGHRPPQPSASGYRVITPYARDD